MATNIKKFLENYKLIMADRSEYVHFEYWEIRKTLEICVCTESFTYDGLLIEKDNIYLLREKEVGYVLYELTGIWIPKGHQGKMLTTKAVVSGIRGWNIPSRYKDCFKIVKPSFLPFLYSEV